MPRSDYYCAMTMQCSQAMEVFSADLDGEAALTEVAAAMGHASTCLPCRQNRHEMASLHRMLQDRPHPIAPDFAQTAVAESRRSLQIRRGVARLLLAVVAIFLFFAVIPQILATSGDAHMEHHLAVWGVTYALVLMTVAIKPALSRLVRPIATIFGVSMLVIAVIDIIRGETPMLAETHHLLELAGVVLIWVLSLPARVKVSPQVAGLSLYSEHGDGHAAAS